MTKKVVNSIKLLGVLLLLASTLLSCEKEIEDIGVNLVDNNKFSTADLTSEVIANTQNIENVTANGLQQYLLGLYSDNEFGKLKASIVTQLNLPATGSNYTYGTNVNIDSVLINIPYQTTKLENLSDGRPQFKIDSVFGNKEVPFKLSVFELKTFLNTLDPNDPSKSAIYKSDKVFQKGDTPFYEGSFKVNATDTVAYIKRYLADGVTVYDTDTIKEATASPSIKIPMNTSMIRQYFVDNADAATFSSTDDFNHFFRGLYIEASMLNASDSHLISLNLAKAAMTIYYSIDEDEGVDVDLNGNGTNGETGVRTKHKYSFLFGAIKSNVLERDYTVSKQSGTDRLYIQGAAGSMATVELFNNEDLTSLQSNNWLINEANLIFYVDQNAASNIAPEQLFLYNYDDNLQIRDVMTEGIDVLGGKLERDENGKPTRYVFKITDYISEVLKPESTVNLVKLGIKVHNSTDAPTSVTDTKIKELSWNPKGVVLYGNSLSAGDKRVKLQLYYSQINN